MNKSHLLLKKHIFSFSLFIVSFLSMPLTYNTAQAETLADFLNDTSGNWEIRINSFTDGGCDRTNGNLCSVFVFGNPIVTSSGGSSWEAGMVSTDENVVESVANSIISLLPSKT